MRFATCETETTTRSLPWFQSGDIGCEHTRFLADLEFVANRGFKWGPCRRRISRHPTELQYSFTTNRLGYEAQEGISRDKPGEAWLFLQHASGIPVNRDQQCGAGTSLTQVPRIQNAVAVSGVFCKYTPGVKGAEYIHPAELKKPSEQEVGLALEVAEKWLASLQASVIGTLVRSWTENEMTRPVAIPEVDTFVWYEAASCVAHGTTTSMIDSAGVTASIENSHLLPATDAFDQARLILNDALTQYRRPDGYEGYLVEAAWQLEKIGREAWPALRDLILEGVPECEYFLGAVVRSEGITSENRLITLLAAARNPDTNVRSRLLELLDEMPVDLRVKVLGELTAENRPDDSVTDRAQEATQELAS